MKDPQIIVALDFNNQEQALSLVEKLAPDLCRLKIGKELFTACGPDIVRRVQDSGFDVFLDLKFHDIPATVAKACVAAADLGVWMLNVHAMGGATMLSAAKSAIEDCKHSPYLIAVTVLTSMDQAQLSGVGVNKKINRQVSDLMLLTNNAGLDGVVCSAKECKFLRSEAPKNFIFVTPGIRPQGIATNDQIRVVTPKDAIANGANYLVVGRPITQSVDPMSALREMHLSIASI